MQELLDSFFSRHQRVMLQFSAGKDSAAVLWSLRPYWDRIDVVWCNPGAPYPETLIYMQQIEKLVPRFICVLGDQPNDISANGWPVDIVPMESTRIGMIASDKQGILLRPFWECCNNNFWKPMADLVIQGGYTGVIRGQKDADKLKSPVRSGHVVDGVEYLYPIESWTDLDVFEFLGEERLPASYKRGLASSLDCINCTAYTIDNPGKAADLVGISGQALSEVSAVHSYLLELLVEHTERMRCFHG